MTITITTPAPTRALGSSDELLVRMLSSSSPSRERLLVVEGGIGSGKTHALRSAAATARASGREVIEVRPDRGDAVISASSLALFAALLGHLQRVRDASGTPVQERAFLIVVDDWERFDVAARDTLQALVTQLVDEAGASCVVATTDRRVLAGWGDLRHRRMEALDAEAARRLLSARGIELPLPVETRLLRVAEGNPLLLDALGRAWADSDAAALHSPFPTYPRLADAEPRVLEQVRSLSERCRDALLLTAVAGAEFPATRPPSPADPAALREAVQEGILSAGERTFRDPVVRAVVLSTAAPRALQAARRQLAAGVDGAPHLRLLLGEGDEREPEERAILLRDAACGRLRAGRPQEALLLLAQARPSARSRSLRDELDARAAVTAAFLGDGGTLARAIAGSREGERPLEGAVEAARLFDALMRGADLRETRSAVVRALASVRTPDPARAPVDPRADGADVLVTVLHFACVLRGDPAWWQDALALGAERRLDPVLRVVEACLVPVTGDEWERRVLLAEDSAASGDPWKAVALHLAWSLLDVSDERGARLGGLLEGAEQAGGLVGALALTRGAVAAFHHGRLDEASADLDRAAAQAADLPTVLALIDSTRALVHAVRGDHHETLASGERATAWALQHGAPVVARAADHARSTLDLAGGRFEEAHARFSARPPTASGGRGPGYGPLELLDAAEAASRLRLPERCAELAAVAAEIEAAPLTRRQRMLVLAASAVLDTTSAAGSLFEQSLALASEEFPLERARVQLCSGEWLRRRMRPMEARTRFRLAVAGFAALGAELWHARAQHELRVAGGAGEAPPVAAAGGELSEQERRVVSLAAAGLSNKQIAHQLFVSPRTVSGHLYRIFPKLGVTSRAGLRDALLSLEAAESGAR